MNIYLAHSRSFKYKKELYEPIKQSSLYKEHIFILPHEKSNKLFSSKKYLENECNLVIAEVSEPSTGLGIELGWANVYNVPIVYIYKSGLKLSNSLKVISNNFIEYSTSEELISEIKKILIKIKI